MSERKTSARFAVLSAPFGRPTLLKVKIVPLGRDASVEIRQARRRGVVVVSLGELAGAMIEREARRLAAERVKSNKRGRKNR